MDDRRYKYRKPLGQEEHLEAIYEELSRSPQQKSYWNNVTLKDLLGAILDNQKNLSRQRENEKQQASYAVTWAITMLGLASVALISNGIVRHGDWAWLDEHRFAVRLWGIGFAAVFLGVSIERSAFFRSVWAFGFTKLVASVALSGLIVFSTGRASSLINSVFAVDAAALPLTRAIVAALLVFQYAYPLLLLVALFATLHLFHLTSWIANRCLGKGRYQQLPLQSIVFSFLALVTLFFSTRWVNRDFSEELWPAKVYRLAHILDFNSKHGCANLPEGLSVVFLGPEQKMVLVDRNKAQTDDMKSFVDGQISSQIAIPARFDVLRCHTAAEAQESVPSSTQPRQDGGPAVQAVQGAMWPVPEVRQ